MIFKKYFLKHVVKTLPILIIGIAILITIDYIQLLIPVQAGHAIENLRLSSLYTKDEVYNKLYENLKLILIFGSSVFVGRVSWRFALFGASRNIDDNLRKDLFKHATKLSQSYYQKNKTGAIMSYFLNDVEAVRKLFGMGIMQLVDGTVLLGIAVYKLFSMNAQLAMFGIAPAIFLVGVIFMLRGKMQERFIKKQKSYEKLNDFTQESLTGLSVVKAYARELFEQERFRIRREDYYNKGYEFAKIQKKFYTIEFAIVSFTIILITAYASYIIVFSNFKPGELVTFLSIYGTLTWPLAAIADFTQTFTQANGSAKRIAEFLDTKVDVVDKKDAIYNDNIKGDIVFKNLTFSYPDDEKIILNNISFKIKQGEKVGIFGKTGSGKTTVVELLLRLYNVHNNTLFFNGVDVNKIPIKNVRDIIGYVPQDNFLFSDTVRNNIAFFNKDIEEDKIMEVSKQSAIYENVMGFKDKFDTLIGERGTMISGGQKQRISIARALIKEPEVLILDDAVSAVDVKTENDILNMLFTLRENKTTILIAHRISTIKDMDKIIFLENGKVSAIGSHKELLKSSKTYSDYVFLQSLETDGAEVIK